MIRVLVTGAAGKMGRHVVSAVTTADDMRVVAAVDPGWAGRDVDDGHGAGITCTDDLETAITSSNPAVMVDFTRPDAVADNLAAALARGVDCIVGTTGLPTSELQDLAAQAPSGTCLFVAPNFAIGAVLMMRFAQAAARHMPHAEIVELHHDQKLDAPSGTALRTASLIAGSRTGPVNSPGTETEVATGARGALVDGVPIHSVRLPGLVAHQEVLFGDEGQTLTLRHDSIDRKCFMHGVLLAIRSVGGLTGLVVGLEHLMEQ